ncbi:MAG: response regulator [Planctomycetota bacterium]|jgi:DNA-binding NtrC family response regulator
MTHTVLLVDDEPNVLDGLTRALRKEPYQILAGNSAEEAAALLEDHSVDLIVSDEEMPGMSGTEFLGRVAQEYPDTVRIVLTGHPTLPAALRAINEGKVYQFFTKPCNEIDLAITIRRALEQKDLLEKSRDLLEVAKRQSALIDEARLARRLRSARPQDRAETIAKEGKPADTRELLEEMEGAVRNGRELLRDVRNGPAAQCEPEGSAASASR